MTSALGRLWPVYVWLALGGLMLYYVITAHPTRETILVCLLAWFGGLAFGAAVTAVARIRKRAAAANEETHLAAGAEEGPELEDRS